MTDLHYFGDKQASAPNDAADANIFTPKGWNSKFLAAQNPRIAVVGTSIEDGYWSSDLNATSWVALLRAQLQAAHGNGGSGFVGVGRTSESTSGNVDGYSAKSLSTGTWSPSGADTLNGPGTMFLTGSASDPGTLTFAVSGRIVRVYFLMLPGGGTMSVTIDGIAYSSIDTASPVGVDFAEFDTGAAGAHTVIVTNNGDGGKYVSLFGVSAHNETGLAIDNFSAISRTSLSFSGYNGAGDPATYANPALWSGGPAYPEEFDMIIYAQGVNDSLLQIDPLTAFPQYVRNYLNVAREGPKQPDLLFIAQHVGKSDTKDTNYKSGRYAEHVRSLMSLADAYGAAFVNMWGIGRNSWDYSNDFGYWGLNASGSSGTDNIHPSDIGHGLIAETVGALF